MHASKRKDLCTHARVIPSAHRYTISESLSINSQRCQLQVAYLLPGSSTSLLTGDTVASLPGKDAQAPPVLSLPPKGAPKHIQSRSAILIARNAAVCRGVCGHRLLQWPIATLMAAGLIQR